MRKKIRRDEMQNILWGNADKIAHLLAFGSVGVMQGLTLLSHLKRKKNKLKWSYTLVTA